MGTPIEDAMQEVQRTFFDSFEEMVEHKGDTICYPDWDEKWMVYEEIYGVDLSTLFSKCPKISTTLFIVTLKSQKLLAVAEINYILTIYFR